MPRTTSAAAALPAVRALRTILTAAAFAAAVALLALLPAFGQSTFDRTDGEIGSGSGLTIGVFADIADAQLEKDRGIDRGYGTVFLPLDDPTDYLGRTTGSLTTAVDPAYLADGRVSPRHTFFGDTLWASNDPAAYNTILITAESNGRVIENDDFCAVATVRNSRFNSSITVQMPVTAATETPDGMKSYYQAFVRILDPRAVLSDGTLAYESSDDGPACTAYNTGMGGVTGVAHADTPFILARHGDRVTIEVEGVGLVSLEVDGEGPDVLDVTPEDLRHVQSRDLELAFTVRDHDAGLRHDGELVITEDGDYTQVNADDDHTTTGEPLSMPSGGQISVNGASAEIDVMVWSKDAHVKRARDITDTGRWTLVGSRPGVAYSFSADGSSMDEGAYFMEITAFDRTGNRTVTAAPDDEIPGPYLFTVDDTDPKSTQAWTGIAYDLDAMNGGREIADRSWIMVDFVEPLRRNVTPELIRVAGHEVVRVLHPTEVPPPERRVLAGADAAPVGPQRLTFAPPAPRAAASLAPQTQGVTCTAMPEGTAIAGLRFNYNETTGDSSVSWTRPNHDGYNDCGGYRLSILSERTPLHVAHLAAGTSSLSIPRASELGREIEAMVKDPNTRVLNLGLVLRPGAGATSFHSGLTSRSVNLNVTAPMTTVSETVTAPFLLHPATPPATLPAISARDANITCGFTQSGNDEVAIDFMHRPGEVDGWTLIGYYTQLFYPPDPVNVGRLFSWIDILENGHEWGSSSQGFFDWETPQDFHAEGQVVAVYEKDGRRLAGAVRTIWCTGRATTEPVVDTIPPFLDKAAVGGSTLTLTYNELLDGGSTPATSVFDVRVDGAQRTVTNVDVSGSIVTLTLSSAVSPGERVTLDYTKPGAHPIQDVAGNDAFSFRLWPVSNALAPVRSALATVSNPLVAVESRDDFVDVDGRTHEEVLAELGYWPIDINDVIIPDVRSRIYIQVARELRADETPELLLFGGGVYDLAGNPNESENVNTRDGIAPRFTITVTAMKGGEVPASAGTTGTSAGTTGTSAGTTGEGRPVANHQGEFIVDVRADEDLRRRPELYFTGLDAEKVTRSGDDEYDYSIDNLDRGGALATQEGTHHWGKTYAVSGLSGLDELFGLVVYGFDYEGNIGESGGWTPDRHQRRADPATTPRSGNDLDLGDMHDAGALLEIDREFNGGIEPELSMTPHRFEKLHETESVRPYVNLDFSGEENEYAVCPTNGCGDDNPDAEFFDSHANVNVTAITLDDGTMMTRLARVGPMEFAFQTEELDLGRHEVAYTAVDDAGNEFRGTYTFSVVERTPYELELTPGWNLISVPGTPADPSLDAVLPPAGRVSPVLSYQDGDWVTAVANADGEWGGNLSTIEAGPGYWVFATTFETLSPLIPETDPTFVPQAMRVDYGWNLVGVTDLFQNPSGTPPGAYGGGSGEADEYFDSIPWRIAYTYNTLRSRWVRTVPGADRNVLNDDGSVKMQ